MKENEQRRAAKAFAEDWMQELRAQCLAGKITTDELIAQGKAKKKAMAAAMEVERKKMTGK